jgi:hypothetical protein
MNRLVTSLTRTTRGYIDAMAHRVYLEEGKKLVFAVSLDWPGWCRSARSRDRALESLRGYAPRYRAIVGDDDLDEEFDVIGVVPGNATTDFGAPRVMGPWDEVVSTRLERLARVKVLRSCWRYFDQIVATAPAELLKGPRGGGRDRDEIADHVREAERAYAPKIGLRIAPRTPWSAQREMLARWLLADASHEKWPSDFALRIIAWHVVDHAWEIEDRTP